MTEVTMQYTTTQNVSITVRDGRIDKVTTWVTGVSDSTKRVKNVPKKFK